MRPWMPAVPALLSAACLFAAAGAGAAGGIYFTERGAESVVPVSVERAADATQRAFDALKIRKTKVETQDEGAAQKRQISGTAADRELTVSLSTEQQGSTKVQVVARKSLVTWDKDYARSVLQQIVAFSK